MKGFDNYWDFAASGLHNDIFEVRCRLAISQA